MSYFFMQPYPVIDCYNSTSGLFDLLIGHCDRFALCVTHSWTTKFIIRVFSLVSELRYLARSCFSILIVICVRSNMAVTVITVMSLNNLELFW